MEDLRRKDDMRMMQIEKQIVELHLKTDRNLEVMKEMLEAWSTVRGGMKALEFLAKLAKIGSAFLVFSVAAWAAIEQFLRK